ncbi:MAG TPA: hypothetical protein VGI83_01510 [Gemmatimonadales bacterium]|jgi:hypothetical protein
MSSTRNRVRAALLAAGGAPAAGLPASHAGPPIQQPFGSAERVEHPAGLRAIDPGAPVAPPDGIGFLDGIQRYTVEGHFSLNPVVRGYVAAAVLVRRDRALERATHAWSEFLVIPPARLTPRQQQALKALDLEILESEAGPRAHPLMDVHAAAVQVERRREETERRVALEFATRDGAWLVVDGAITGLPLPKTFHNVIGVVKSHETQFLSGDDLGVALTLPAGHRTSVFARVTESGKRVFTWYLRLWSSDGEGLLHGLVRVERPDRPACVDDADAVSRWIVAEKAPVASPDRRWDRLLYPVHKVEDYLRAQAGAG